MEGIRRILGGVGIEEVWGYDDDGVGTTRDHLLVVDVNDNINGCVCRAVVPVDGKEGRHPRGGGDLQIREVRKGTTQCPYTMFSVAIQRSLLLNDAAFLSFVPLPSAIRRHGNTPPQQKSRWEDHTLASTWQRAGSYPSDSFEAPFGKVTLSKLLVLKDRSTREDYFAQQAAFVTLEGRKDVRAVGIPSML